jgi:DNA polymerase elongation subunit (family B)
MPKKIIGYQEVGKRADSVGLFWSEPLVIHAPPQTKIKRTPPEPVWLEPGYLPEIEEAHNTNYNLFKGDELWYAAAKGERLVFDIEQYPNYFLIMFKSIDSGKVVYFEITDDSEIMIPTLKKVVESFLIIGFNSRNYDIPMLALALAGKSRSELNTATHLIIHQRMRPYEILREFKCKGIDPSHIDLIEVAPLSGSLKIYGGRAHTERLQDLPFAPGTVLTPDQIDFVRWYCLNDLKVTEDLYRELERGIDLRSKMSQKYNVDLRSKSDAQIAEAVIGNEIKRMTGQYPSKVEIPAYTSYRYQDPGYLNFKTPLLKWVKEVVLNTNFIVGEGGSVEIPEPWKEIEEIGSKKGLKFAIGGTTYQLGIGGLHSCEAKQAHFSDERFMLVDRDVVSYYPRIILNQQLTPDHLGQAFLKVFNDLVEQRLQAKRTGNTIVNESMKITINGSFGKFGNRWSILYSPRLVFQVTITGQLSLLYLIEKIELAGIGVVSANTDGLVIKCPRSRKGELDQLIKEWERESKFETEETIYAALMSRSVNDYMAVLDQSFKVKGKGGLGRGINRLFKNPTNFICLTALEKFFSQGIPIEKTICESTDIRDFLTVRVVKGGGVHNGVFLGKAVRWYYAKDKPDSEIIYAKTGNLVAKSTGATPLMKLPSEFPPDVDHERYIDETYEMLRDMGYSN